MTPSFVFTAIFALTMASGDVLESEEESFKTYDACMMQAEADAKNMAKEWQWLEEHHRPCLFKKVAVRCERRPAGKRHVR